jgi:hypothetical protein
MKTAHHPKQVRCPMISKENRTSPIVAAEVPQRCPFV